MTDAIVIVGNVRDGECEGIVSLDTEVLLLDFEESSKITTNQSITHLKCHHHDPKSIQANIDWYFSSSTQHIALLNFRERYVRTTHTLARTFSQYDEQHIGVLTTLSKADQRRQYAQKPQLDVPFVEVGSNGLRSAAHHIGLPVVLKPANLHSSLFTSTAVTCEHIDNYITTVVPKVLTYAGQTPTFICEPYLRGSLHSVDCVVALDGTVHITPVVDVITGSDIGWSDFHHFARFAPTRLSSLDVLNAQQIAVQAVHTLGLRGTVAHVEFVVTEIGPKLIEVAARPGGNRIHVLRNAHGVDLDKAYGEALLGRNINVDPKWSKPFGVVTPFARQPQLFRGLTGEVIRKLPRSVSRVYSYAQYGDAIGPVNEGHQNYMYLELLTSSVEELISDINDLAVRFSYAK